eukprot:g23577.t1
MDPEGKGRSGGASPPDDMNRDRDRDRDLISRFQKLSVSRTEARDKALPNQRQPENTGSDAAPRMEPPEPITAVEAVSIILAARTDSEVLGLVSPRDEQEVYIKDAFKTWMLLVHPDKCGGDEALLKDFTEAAKRLNAARDALIAMAQSGQKPPRPEPEHAADEQEHSPRRSPRDKPNAAPPRQERKTRQEEEQQTGPQSRTSGQRRTSSAAGNSGDGRYTCESETTPGLFYDLNYLRQTCTCPAFVFRRRPCKHLWKLNEWIQWQNRTRAGKNSATGKCFHLHPECYGLRNARNIFLSSHICGLRPCSLCCY